MMLETIMTSKVRVKLIKHFLEHPGERFYLRQLERLLQESLTPLRRELIRLRQHSLLIEEREANVKYFRINEKFEHRQELGKLMGVRMTTPSVSSGTPTREFVGVREGNLGVMEGSLGIREEEVNVGVREVSAGISVNAGINERDRRGMEPDSHALRGNQVKESGNQKRLPVLVTWPALATALVMIAFLQVGIFYWKSGLGGIEKKEHSHARARVSEGMGVVLETTQPTRTWVAQSAKGYVMTSDKVRLESGGFGSWE